MRFVFISHLLFPTTISSAFKVFKMKSIKHTIRHLIIHLIEYFILERNFSEKHINSFNKVSTIMALIFVVLILHVIFLMIHIIVYYIF